jgi:putative transposase
VLCNQPKHATPWSVRVAAETSGISNTVARYLALFGLLPHRNRSFKLFTAPFFVEKSEKWWGFALIHPTRRWCCA